MGRCQFHAYCTLLTTRTKSTKHRLFLALILVSLTRPGLTSSYCQEQYVITVMIVVVVVVHVEVLIVVILVAGVVTWPR